MEIMDIDVKCILLFVCVTYSVLLISVVDVILFVHYLYLILKLKHEAIV